MKEFMAQSWQFVKEAYSELKKVAWLSKKEVIASTVVVVILVIIVAIFVGTVDFVLARILAILL